MRLLVFMCPQVHFHAALSCVSLLTQLTRVRVRDTVLLQTMQFVPVREVETLVTFLAHVIHDRFHLARAFPRDDEGELVACLLYNFLVIGLDLAGQRGSHLFLDCQADVDVG
jgi:hypothetical protein